MQVKTFGKALALTVAVVALAEPMNAQSQGTFEAGIFGRYTFFDSDLTLSDRPGFGGRVGVFFLKNLELEATASYTPTKPDGGTGSISYIPLHARLVYNAPISEKAAVLLGAGFVHNEYGKDADASDNGANALLGLRYWLTDALSLRIEGLADFMPSQITGASSDWNIGAQFGLSYMLGGGSPADTDMDGVPDSADDCPNTAANEQVDMSGCALDNDRDGVTNMRDRCPDTPSGERVDSNGCALDTDRDGVRDSMDRCANTPAGTAVDATGCPRDADGDGVADSADRCPNTPQGTAVDANGCARDNDGDGVADAADRCPSTPRGAEVNTDGCPIDSDNDGVANGIDRCPSTAPNTDVDPVGCPVLFAEEATTIVLEGVNFATSSAELTAEARETLNTVAQTLVANSGIRVEVGGHTDNTGSRTGNVALSQARAESVMQYLISRGVAANRMEARGYGPDQPIADNGTRAGRAENRRVELRRISN